MNRLLVSDDGSHTIHSDKFSATYHSTHGSIQESQIVFIDAGLSKIDSSHSEIKVLEMGFGSGLNFLMTLKEFLSNSELPSILYHGIEAYPISIEILKCLNYLNHIGLMELEEPFNRSHVCEPGKTVQLYENAGRIVRFMKMVDKVEVLNLTNSFYNLIYYDAFGPLVQPFLWEVPILKRMYSALDANGVLVTYCAKGSFKRNLKSVGFEVEALPGPKGKREMTRAIKK